MIGAVAFVPQAPLLVPALTGGGGPELDELRAACRSAIADVAPGRRLVLVAAGAANTAYPSTARGDLSGHGAALEIGLGGETDGPVTLPVALTVGAWLVRDAVGADSGAVGHSLDPDDPYLPPELASGDEEIALIVLGDGSACRTLKAPRYLDDRAAAFDEEVADILREGDPALLGSHVLDQSLIAQLHVAGAPVWHACADLLAGSQWNADLRYDDAPFGVGYFVATWTRA